MIDVTQYFGYIFLAIGLIAFLVCEIYILIEKSFWGCSIIDFKSYLFSNLIALLESFLIGIFGFLTIAMLIATLIFLFEHYKITLIGFLIIGVIILIKYILYKKFVEEK